MNEYKNWFESSWREASGLITPTQIAKLLSLKGGSASIIPMWKKRNLKIYYFRNQKNKPLLSWKDYLLIEKERNT